MNEGSRQHDQGQGHEPFALRVEVLGVVDYADALARQEDLVARRARDEVGDTLLLLEHPALFTLGRGSDRASLPQNSDLPLIETRRGGNITYHGPGQIVGYWIRKLVGEDRDLHRHLRLIEELLIRSLADFEVAASHREGLTGVWTEGGKIASIGVAVRSWVTYHGFALNIDVDPAIYRHFRPCGLEGSVMTNLATELKNQAATPKVEGHHSLAIEALTRAFKTIDPSTTASWG
ncbi:MAG: lipoyl(octanoyl) transferase LipB [Planctomycetota bacterium]